MKFFDRFWTSFGWFSGALIVLFVILFILVSCLWKWVSLGKFYSGVSQFLSFLLYHPIGPTLFYVLMAIIAIVAIKIILGYRPQWLAWWLDR